MNNSPSEQKQAEWTPEKEAVFRFLYESIDIEERRSENGEVLLSLSYTSDPFSPVQEKLPKVEIKFKDEEEYEKTCSSQFSAAVGFFTHVALNEDIIINKMESTSGLFKISRTLTLPASERSARPYTRFWRFKKVDGEKMSFLKGELEGFYEKKTTSNKGLYIKNVSWK